MASAAEVTGWQPDKSITVIVPSNPGGGWDQTARFLQRTILSENLSPVSVDVINRGGAGGTIGLAELVERYHADSHKLLITGFGMVGSVLVHGSEHNLLSTTPIARLTSEYQAIAVPADSPIQSVNDLIAAFKSDPKSVSWGGGSAGGSDHIFVYLLAEALGIEVSEVTYVAFTGGGEASAALLGGQVVAGISGYSEWGGLAESGRVRLLALSSDERLEGSSLPTLKEFGIDVVFANWRGILAAPGISRDEKAWLVDTITKTRNSQAWRDVLERNRWEDSFLIGAEFEQFILEDSRRTARTLARLGVGSDGGSWAAVGPYLFPSLAGIVLVLTGGAIAFSSFQEARARTTPGGLRPTEATEPVPDLKRFLLAAAVVFTYILGLRALGFIYMTPVLIVALARVIGSRQPLRDAIVGIILTGLIVLIFENLLNVEVP